MKRIFITGSSDGLGFQAAKLLTEIGHQVVLHARNESRAKEAKLKFPACEAVVIGDLSLLSEMKSVAEQVNRLGRFDCIIHNVGVYGEGTNNLTEDGNTLLFAVNIIAPYVLSALIEKPDRLIYLSSGMHTGGVLNFDDLQWQNRNWNSTSAYSDSKLYDLILTKWLSKNLPNTYVNAVDPGWIPTKMGGPSAPGNLVTGAQTQVWLASSDDIEAKVSGKYFHHEEQQNSNPVADEENIQDKLIEYLEEITGIKFSI